MEKEFSDTIRHFTNVHALFHILKDGMKFSSGTKWADKDDSYDIETYRKLINNDVASISFCNGLGTIHHWDIGKCHKKSLNVKKNIRCYISLYTEDFFEYINSLGKFENPKSVIYCHEVAIIERDISDIPYLKKIEYNVEKEIRILYVGDNPMKNAIIPNVVPYVKCICINKEDCDKETFANIKNELVNLCPSLKGRIILNDSNWQDYIDILIKHKLH